MLQSFLLLISFLGSELASVPAELPVESVTLYRNSVAWIVRAGVVSVKEGTVDIAIDPSAVPQTWNVDAEMDGPQPLSLTTDSYGPLGSESWSQWASEHAGQSFIFTLADEKLLGALPLAERSPVGQRCWRSKRPMMREFACLIR